MRKFFLAIACLLAASVFASAQVDYAAFEARGAFVVNQGKPGISADFLNIQVKGHIGPSLRFRFRHRLTKPIYDAKNPLNGTDILSLTWDVSPKWSISGGKLPIFIGGYEWDAAPIDVYYYSGFCNGIQQVYGLGGSAFFRPKEGQELEVQVTHSPLHGDGAGDRVAGGILVGPRRPEHGDDRVPDELQDIALPGVDDLDHLAEIMIEHVDEIHRVHLLRKLRRTPQIGEHHRDRPTFAADLRVFPVLQDLRRDFICQVLSQRAADKGVLLLEFFLQAQDLRFRLFQLLHLLLRHIRTVSPALAKRTLLRPVRRSISSSAESVLAGS